jgi:hypothetical protein
MDTSKQQYPSSSSTSTSTSLTNSLPGLANLDQNDLSQILKIFQKYNLKVSFILLKLNETFQENNTIFSQTFRNQRKYSKES